MQMRQDDQEEDPIAQQPAGSCALADATQTAAAWQQAERLAQQWRLGVSRAQDTLTRLRSQRDVPSDEAVAEAAAHAQEAVAKLDACAGLHDFGFSMDFVQSEVSRSAGTVAVDALSAALQAAHLQLLNAGAWANASSLQQLQEAWAALQRTLAALAQAPGAEQGDLRFTLRLL
jgi:hypothetical protein